MPRFDCPIVLVTRPKEASERFVAALMRVAGAFHPLVSPAFKNISTNPVFPEFEAVVFTSHAGVAFAPDGQNRTAYCVGLATAEAATQAGYQSISADGAASDLISLILARKPKERLLHIRGEVSIGDVTVTLNAGGIECSEVIAYRKSSLPVSTETSNAFKSGQTIILPLFSAETVSILAASSCNFHNCHIVAMSEAVAIASKCLSPTSIVVADKPDQPSMIAETVRLIA